MQDSACSVVTVGAQQGESTGWCWDMAVRDGDRLKKQPDYVATRSLPKDSSWEEHSSKGSPQHSSSFNFFSCAPIDI